MYKFAPMFRISLLFFTTILLLFPSCETENIKVSNRMFRSLTTLKNVHKELPIWTIKMQKEFFELYGKMFQDAEKTIK